MAPTARPKRKDASRVVICVMDFATPTRLFKRGDRVRASDPAVGDMRWFVEEDVPPSEWPNFWNEMPAPPEHRPHIRMAVGIPSARQVRSKVDRFFPGQWAPGSVGEKRGVPSPFGSSIRRGDILDIADPRVAANPSDFETVVRDVTVDDIERVSRE